jgi:AraC-like DNA-binding protein
VHWDAEPGWIGWSFDRPTLCLLREEIGGRAELRTRPDTHSEGEYFGAGHLTFLAAAESVTLYSAWLRQAQFVVFGLDSQQTAWLTAEHVELIRGTPNRLMFRDDRLHSCAQLLADCEGDDHCDPYVVGLSRALLVALVAALSTPSPRSERRLTGSRLARVLAYIVEHVDHKLTNDRLARLAEISPLEFGPAFREATGLSPLRWQMDASVRQAQRLMLDEPERPLAWVARRCGFADQSHFSRAFLDIVGVPPTTWLHRRR